MAPVVGGHHVDEGQVEPHILQVHQPLHLGLAHHARHLHGVMVGASRRRLAPT
jgi:hypothetical protein